MTLEVGQTLSFFEILDTLGAGAMGEVYRARDNRLDREVAIKVLPEHFADEKERLMRFEREAKALATLNHPNIAQIFGVDQVEGTFFLVLELVPGETLEERIARGALPIEEAIEVCRQIAEGLEAAHEAGVIHRDLKPANVRITPDGKVKVLDFGLAKPAGTDRHSAPTTDSVLLTEEGRLLGTPTYMAPEQVRGKPIDRRVDVWALGCVLFECLTGTRAFLGETVSDVLATVLQDEPAWTLLPVATPAHVRELLSRCVAKDPRQRLRDMGDVWLELGRTGDAGALGRSGRAAPLHRRVVIAGIALALVAGAVLGFALHPAPESERPRAAHVAIPQRPDQVWKPSAYWSTFAIASNGDSVVYRSEDRGPLGRADVLVLWRRSEPESRVVWKAGPGLGVQNPIFSPDGAWIVFEASTAGSYELRRILAQGGEPERLCTLPAAILGACWEPDGSILFGAYAGGIYRLRIGGEPEPVTTPVPDVEWSHKFPVSLPGGEELLFVNDYEGPKNEVVLCSSTGDAHEVLVPGATWARYLDPGMLVYATGEDLWATRFDPRTHELGERRVQLSERVQSGIASYVDVGRDGTLAYAAPAAVEPRRSLFWVDREGHVDEIGLPVSDYTHVALSPSGKRAVLGLGAGRGGELLVYDLEPLSTGVPLVTEAGLGPAWTPDGDRIVWMSQTDGHLFRQSVSGGGQPERGGCFESVPLTVHEDGRVLHYSQGKGTRLDLFLAAFGGDPKTDRVPLLVERGSQTHGDLSRDGKWLAYVTLHEGQEPQVFVSPIPAAGPGTQVSFSGGSYPRWSRDGRELYYRTPTGNLMVVAIDSREHGLELAEPVLICDGVSTTTAWPNRPFDVAPDGRRCLVIKDDPSMPAARHELRLCVNWVADVRARLESRD